MKYLALLFFLLPSCELFNIRPARSRDFVTGWHDGNEGKQAASRSKKYMHGWNQGLTWRKNKSLP